MAHVLIMPRQGNTVESCIISEWKVKEGDAVKFNTPVCIVETDKASFEVPAGAGGTVLKILKDAGDDVPVLEPIMVIGEPGEAWEAAVGAEQPASQERSRQEPALPEAVLPSPAVAGSPSAAEGGVAQDGGRIAVSPRARNLAEREAVDIGRGGLITGSGPGGRIIAPDVEAYIAERPPLTAAAKDELRQRIATGGAPGLAAGVGSGIGGRLNLADIQARTGSGISAGPADTGAADYSDTPIKGIRRVIADQMMLSHTGTAAFTLNASAPAVNLQSLRARFKAAAPELGLNRITINDLVLFAASRVLPLYPYMNAHKLDGFVRAFKHIHLGVAVSTARGLMVPVLRNAETLSLLQISAKAKELAEACRTGVIAPDDLHGSTLTVTNLGNTGIESFTPVINVPEVAVLGVCGIQPKPAETAGGYEILPHLGFSLTIDHAVVDGAPAAEFLKALCGAIRDIDLWIAR
jgi:pyruvate dehydrogenase E2 component (dihydrolipoamide acetyltransferase)